MPADDLLELYQTIILDHHKRPRNYRPLAAATHRAAGHNPLCGDQVSVAVVLDPVTKQLTDIAFQGEGCAISRASASLLTSKLKGLPEAQARALADRVLHLLTDTSTSELVAAEEDETLGDLAALSGVRKFPARVKCATLSWHALLAALDGRATPTSTE